MRDDYACYNRVIGNGLERCNLWSRPFSRTTEA
jgi:hypothetical protein